MSDEQRRRAEFQDTLFQAVDCDDRAYYRERAESVDGPVLELGCGTGRIYLDLLEAGVDVDGIELSEASLSVLRENAAERGLTPSVWRGDTSEFATDREYDLIYCPFNAIQELTSIEGQQGLLACASDALVPGGGSSSTRSSPASSASSRTGASGRLAPPSSERSGPTAPSYLASRAGRRCYPHGKSSYWSRPRRSSRTARSETTTTNRCPTVTRRKCGRLKSSRVTLRLRPRPPRLRRRTSRTVRDRPRARSGRVRGTARPRR